MDWELVRTLRIKAPVALWCFPHTSSIGTFAYQSFGSADCNRKSTAAITPFDDTGDIHGAKYTISFQIGADITVTNHAI